MAKADCAQCGGTGYRLVRAAAEAGGAAPSPVAVLCDCAEADRGARALERARIPVRYQHCDFANFETDVPYEDGPQNAAFHRSLAEAKLVVEAFARDYPLTSEAGLLLMGPCGTGKTHLAIAAVKSLVERGHEALFYDYRELLKEIQSSYNPESQVTEMGVLDPVLNTEILLLDDLGASKPSAWALETIGHILNARYNEKRVTVMTTNYLDGEPGGDLPRAVPRTPSGESFRITREETLADRIGVRIRSRLYEMCRTVELVAPDFRREIRRVTGLHR